jgi:hypothetical protein
LGEFREGIRKTNLEPIVHIIFFTHSARAQIQYEAAIIACAVGKVDFWIFWIFNSLQFAIDGKNMLAC